LAHQESGNSGEATKLAAALYEFALKTQNAFLIVQAEAFNAEIALRQGAMAEALKWADHYDPEPLTPMYASYSPAMTLAKVLVLEDGEKSRERADGLLNRLIDYLTRTHNRRFLIEALALRAMLLDASGDEEAARNELLTAVSMAQPGRFIRVFVDLGPRLGNLLHVCRGSTGRIQGELHRASSGYQDGDRCYPASRRRTPVEKGTANSCPVGEPSEQQGNC